MVHHPLRYSSFALCCLLFVGCSGQPGAHHFEEHLDRGTVDAVNRGAPLFGEELFVYKRMVQLTQDPQVPESLLYPGAIRRWDHKGFLMDASGWFYVQDRGNRRIAVFDPEGRYARSIGRGGNGPGEFTFLQLTGIRGDVLYAYDESLHRITLYRTDGTLEETMRTPLGGGQVYFDTADSTFIGRDFQEAEEDEGITTMAAGFRACTHDGEVVGQGHTPPIEMYYAYSWVGHKGGIGGEDMPFTSYPSMAWTLDRGVYLINGKTPVIWQFDTDGTLLRKMSLDLPDRKVTVEDRSRFTADLDKRIEESAGDEHDVLQATRQTLTFPDTKSHWNSITVDEHGYIWLEVAEWPDDAERPRGAGCTYQVLSPEGEYLGSTRAPAAGRIQNGHLLAVVTDPETGADEHVVWSIVPNVGGLEYPEY